MQMKGELDGMLVVHHLSSYDLYPKMEGINL